MIAALDVHYVGDDRASAAAVLFHAYRDAEPALEFVGLTEGVSRYIPGHYGAASGNGESNLCGTPKPLECGK
jgi:hypothetical protein